MHYLPTEGRGSHGGAYCPAIIINLLFSLLFIVAGPKNPVQNPIKLNILFVLLGFLEGFYRVYLPLHSAVDTFLDRQ